MNGIRIGHWTDSDALTGCTVVLAPPGTVGSGFVPGGAPATRETDLLRPGMLVHHVDAVVLAGGSAFGLSAADGVVRWLEEHGRGFDTGVTRVPIVPAAALFDLWIGDAGRRPGPEEGYAACAAASDSAPAEGNAGAGTGATVGKGAGPAGATKGGTGWAEKDGVAALAVVNAWGDVMDEDGSTLAGARLPVMSSGPPWTPPSTTLACVITEAVLTKEEAERVARMAAAGLARAIRPVNTMFDGDAVFVLATQQRPARVDVVGASAADAVAAAVRRGVMQAESVDGAPACTSPGGKPYAER